MSKIVNNPGENGEATLPDTASQSNGNSQFNAAKYRKFENVHVFLWLIKDFAWISGFQFLGIFMAVPTIGMAFYITYLSRTVSESDFVHNIAVSCWIMANVIWMVGEFYFEDEKREWAMPFFILGILVLLVFYGRRLLNGNLNRGHS